jgi:hypothetical protein
VARRSGLAARGWVLVDTANLATPFPGAYGLGDVANANYPEAGVFGETAAQVVPDHIAARLDGSDRPLPFEGDGTCYIGDGRDDRGHLFRRAHANSPNRRPVARVGCRKASYEAS